MTAFTVAHPVRGKHSRVQDRCGAAEPSLLWRRLSDLFCTSSY